MKVLSIDLFNKNIQVVIDYYSLLNVYEVFGDYEKLILVKSFEVYKKASEFGNYQMDNSL